MRIIIAVLSMAVITSSCASTDKNERKPRGIAALQNDPRLGEEVDKICFSRNISGFESLDERTIILRRNVKDRYVVETYGTCTDLDSAWEIALDSFSSCIRKQDRIILTRTTSRPFNRTCHIKSIHKWNRKANNEASDNMEKPKEEKPNTMEPAREKVKY